MVFPSAIDGIPDGTGQQSLMVRQTGRNDPVVSLPSRGLGCVPRIFFPPRFKLRTLGIGYDPLPFFRRYRYWGLEKIGTERYFLCFIVLIA